MAALIEHARRPEASFEVALVIADGDAKGIETAQKHNIKTALFHPRDYSSITNHEQAIIDAITESKAELVCLAGYMRVFSADFCRRYKDRIINIHPSLLPRHKGLDTHRRALESGDTEHGCSVHFVTAGIDEGEVIESSSVPINADDTPDTLCKKVLDKEHKLYPLVVDELVKKLATSTKASVNKKTVPNIKTSSLKKDLVLETM